MWSSLLHVIVILIQDLGLEFGLNYLGFIIYLQLVEANRKEFQKSKDLEFKTTTESAHLADCQVSSENQLTSYRESESVTDRPFSSDSSLLKCEYTEGSNINLNTTDDGGSLSMIDLLMGHLLKKSEEVEGKTDAITDKFMLDYERSKRNQIENLSEMVPVSNKSNFKDKVRELLDWKLRKSVNIQCKYSAHQGRSLDFEGPRREINFGPPYFLFQK